MNNMVPKVMILSKDLSLPGGVTNYFRIFFKKYDHQDIAIKHFKQGLRKPQRKGQSLEYIIQYPLDLLLFFKNLLTDRSIKFVHLNPSFFIVPLLRDIPYIILSKIFRKKIVVLIHGWDVDFYSNRKDSLLLKLISFFYKRTDQLMVLSEDFQKNLEDIGYSNISVIKTFFERELFDGYEIEKNSKPNFLFLGRMQEGKGIFDIIESLNLLNKDKIAFHSNFIGWFSDDDTERVFNEKLVEYDLSNKVKYLGYRKGRKKVEKFIESDVFLYPSYYSEGCPTVVIEALAGGCYIISTDVAALKEVIIDGTNGSIVKSKDPEDIYKQLKQFLANYDDNFEIMKNNREEAYRKYESKIIIDKIHDIYLKCM